MNIRNARYMEDGRIDLEWLHPTFGWIPSLTSPDDLATAELFAEAQAAGPSAYEAPPPAEPLPYTIAKTTPWLRMTDDEAAIMDGVMSETTARLKQIYMAAAYLSSDDPLWATLHQMLVNAFGSTRADELLAPEA